MKLKTQSSASPDTDQWIQKFLTHLATDRNASIYTQRNYKQALEEFFHWHKNERKATPVWEKLHRDDFRAYLPSSAARSLDAQPSRCVFPR